MTESSTKTNQSGIQRIADLAFFAWIVLTFFFERDDAGRIALFVFGMAVGLCMMVNNSIYNKNIKNISAVNIFFVSYACFVIYNYWHINYSDMIISTQVAQLMFKTICLNFVFMYLVYRYCALKNDMTGVLNIYVITQMIIMAIVIAGSGGDLLSGRLGGAMEINANVIALAMINCIVIVMHANSKEKKNINTIIMIICIVCILLTGSRKGLIGVALGFMLYYGMGGGIAKIKNLAIAAVVVVIAYLLIMNVDVLYDIAGYRVEALLSYFKGESFEEQSLATRDGFAELGWKFVERNPWYGYGLGCFSVLDGAYNTYSHNNYLELLFGCGIIGTAFYYLGYLYILFGHIKLYFKDKCMESKPYIVLMIIQMFLEYAYVSYFERKNILFVIISLAALQISKSKMQSEGDKNEKIEEHFQESL